MRVELKCTVLSSATGRSIRSSLCGEPVRMIAWERPQSSLGVLYLNLQEWGRVRGWGQGWESSIRNSQRSWTGFAQILCISPIWFNESSLKNLNRCNKSSDKNELRDVWFALSLKIRSRAFGWGHNLYMWVTASPVFPMILYKTAQLSNEVHRLLSNCELRITRKNNRSQNGLRPNLCPCSLNVWMRCCIYTSLLLHT